MPVNNFSVFSGWVFLYWTSTKQAQNTGHWHYVTAVTLPKIYF